MLLDFQVYKLGELMCIWQVAKSPCTIYCSIVNNIIHAETSIDYMSSNFEAAYTYRELVLNVFYEF